jgi:hypothetical protein
MINPTHIAEDLIAKMYNQSQSVRELFAEALNGAIYFNTAPTAVPSLRLSSCARFRFDGAHKIDIAIIDSAALRCVPCEAKLGNDRLGKKEFGARFLKPCSQTAHPDPRIGGSMISILERKLPSECLDVPVCASYEGRDHQVTLPWILIMRKAIYDSWERHGTPPLSPMCIRVSFESIVQAFGGKEPFNTLVCKLVSFDYYDIWKV